MRRLGELCVGVAQAPGAAVLAKHVTCYTVHRDGRTLFVSIGGCAPATLSFDTAESVIRDGDCRWKQHGQWQLPFTGRAYYEHRLEAWVGLSRDPRTIDLCSCDAVPTNASQQQCPAMKLSKEKLSSEVPEERQIGATLVRMGEGKFCLLECVYIQADEQTGSDGEKNEDSVDEVTEKKDHRKRFIRLTTFSASYDKNGDLTTVNSRRLRYYSVPEEVTEPMFEHPVAYWM